MSFISNVAAVNGAPAAFPSVHETPAPRDAAAGNGHAPTTPTPETAAPNPRGGPRTPDGKRRASQNALKHGLCSARVILPGEDASDYTDLATSLRHALQPRDNYELTLLAGLTRLHWQLQRLERLGDDALARQAATTASPSLLLHQNIDTWLKLERLAASLQRRIDRGLRQLRDYRKDCQQAARAASRADLARHALHGLAVSSAPKKQEADVDVRPPEETATPAPENTARPQVETCEKRENELLQNNDHPANNAASSRGAGNLPAAVIVHPQSSSPQIPATVAARPTGATRHALASVFGPKKQEADVDVRPPMDSWGADL